LSQLLLVPKPYNFAVAKLAKGLAHRATGVKTRVPFCAKELHWRREAVISSGTITLLERRIDEDYPRT